MKKVKFIIGTIAFTAILMTSCGGSSSRKAESIKEVAIGTQIWMSENLNVDKFRNGDPIPEAKTAEEWIKAGENKEPAWSYYRNLPANGERDGKLYNWYAVNDPRGLAPEGWRIPTDDDWAALVDFLGGESVAGEKMKYTDFWVPGSGEIGKGNNESGLSVLPGGTRTTAGLFRNIDYNAYFWSSTEYDEETAWTYWLRWISSPVNRYSAPKANGNSIRCVKDN